MPDARHSPSSDSSIHGSQPAPALSNSAQLHANAADLVPAHSILPSARAKTTKSPDRPDPDALESAGSASFSSSSSAAPLPTSSSSPSKAASRASAPPMTYSPSVLSKIPASASTSIYNSATSASSPPSRPISHPPAPPRPPSALLQSLDRASSSSPTSSRISLASSSRRQGGNPASGEFTSPLSPAFRASLPLSSDQISSLDSGAISASSETHSSTENLQQPSSVTQLPTNTRSSLSSSQAAGTTSSNRPSVVYSIASSTAAATIRVRDFAFPPDDVRHFGKHRPESEYLDEYHRFSSSDFSPAALTPGIGHVSSFAWNYKASPNHHGGTGSTSRAYGDEGIPDLDDDDINEQDLYGDPDTNSMTGSEYMANNPDKIQIPEGGLLCEAVYDFPPEAEQEMPLARGDIVRVWDRIFAGWVIATKVPRHVDPQVALTATPEQGLVPEDYLRRIDPEEHQYLIYSNDSSENVSSSASATTTTAAATTTTSVNKENPQHSDSTSTSGISHSADIS